MREIKFRAWDGKEMHYKVNMLSSWGAIKEGYSATPWTDSAKAGIPMQFTGLTDKNGKEIYSGDMVKDNSGDIMQVMWSNKFASFGLHKKGWMYMHYFGEAIDPENCEVIGNIHETKLEE